MSKQPTISKSTYRGSIVFVVLLVVIFILPDVLMQLKQDAAVHLSMEGQETQTAVHEIRRYRAQRNTYTSRKSRYSAPPVAFDPNAYTIEDWMALGLSEKQAAVILKFSSRGLRSNEDLKKIFVISDELFSLIKDSTIYPKREYTSPYERKEEYTAAPAASRKVDLNAATEDELLSVKGIGPFFAKQILKRRDELGGFYTADQLLEVWKMDADKVVAFAPYVIIRPEGLKKLNINTASAADLKKHPYFSWNLANSIVKLRAQNGPFRNIEEVKKSVLMTEELYEKLSPYLSVE